VTSADVRQTQKRGRRRSPVASPSNSVTSADVLQTQVNGNASEFDISIMEQSASNCEELESSIDEIGLIASPTSTNTSKPMSEDYMIHQTGSQKGKPLLVARVGYSYVVDRKRGNTTYWRCSVRSKANHCPATMTQDCDEFRLGRHEDSRPAQSGVEETINVITNVKRAAVLDVFRPTTALVEEVLLATVGSKPLQSMPAVWNIARTANRARQALRPEDPVDLNFVIDPNFIPAGFLKSDITHHGRRHLLFATDHALTILSRAKTWYMDGTFDVVGKPFKQLYSFHAFVRSGNFCKQVPLAFCLMSGRKKTDYKIVIEHLLRLIPSARVRCAVMDFESALWRALADVLPGVKRRGCTFHWTQAVWRKIQSLGLQDEYHCKRDTYKVCRHIDGFAVVAS